MVYFLCPVFNEAINIEALAAHLASVLPGQEKHVVIVNDGSTDNTGELVEKFFTTGQFTLLANQKNSGPGFSFNVGFEFILAISADDADCIVTLEGDNTSDLGLLPMMHSMVSVWNFDLVLASVYVQGGGFSKTTFFRKIISLIANQ